MPGSIYTLPGVIRPCNSNIELVNTNTQEIVAWAQGCEQRKVLTSKQKQQAFSLKPFEKDIPPSAIQLKGHIARWMNTLFVHYEIIGSLLRIDIPGQKQKPSRKKGLWENTCLELFVAARDCDQYREFNLSPSGDWNVFRFEHYRNEGYVDRLLEEPSVTSLPLRTQKRSESFSLDLEFDLDKIIRKDQLLEIGVSAIITFGKSKSYWALTHSDSVPDFHRRDSFIIKL